MKPYNRRQAAAALISGMLALYYPLHAAAVEKILDYHSDITVLADGMMTVTETITVNAEGNRIKRGIYRDFPTEYTDRLGNNYRVGFKLQTVSRNDLAEPHHTQKQANGVRIYIGDKNTLLRPGNYTYRISYTTDRQLGFFNDHDELYWNVTGNGWDFTIDHASARVKLPDPIPVDGVQAQAYTGAFGSSEQDYQSQVEFDGSIIFTTSRALGMHQGLTIVVSWPKGFVHQPDLGEKLGYLLRDNRHLIIALLGFALLQTYYLLVWYKVGRDPAKGVIFPLYEPPDGFSPASMRFIENMGYDKTCFAAAIINLAVKGYIKIKEQGDEYTLQKTGTEADMAPGEAALIKKLMPGSTKSITLKQDNHNTIKSALDAHQAALEKNYEKIYFQTNSIFFMIGVGITVLVLLTSLFTMPSSRIGPVALFFVVWLTIWTFGTAGLVKSAWYAWRRPPGFVKIISAVFYTGFSIPFVAAEVFVAWQLIEMTSWSMFYVIMFAVLINWLFYELLKAPTRAGRKLMDKIAGFRKYIDLAERLELDYKHPQGRSPELFEMYLPYALALGLEQQWGAQFADVLKDIRGDDPGQTRGRYYPSWYSGGNWKVTNISGFTASLGGSFTGAISASSTAPGSSPGGGGGGSSGGGGGGGGGGW
jgi:uncharacterized membrane protein